MPAAPAADAVADTLPQPPGALAVLDELERVAAEELWPGFDPGEVPVALYDGRRTVLARHPSPPAEFAPLPERRDVLVVDGRHSAVTANAPVAIGGHLVAGVLLTDPTSSVRARAATVVHEAFHVFQRQRHPDWTANEVDLFTHPVRDVDALALRRLETRALRSALAASEPAERACQAAAALDLRRRRFGLLPESAVAYERTSELNEGLAQYVEDLAAGAGADELLPDGGFAPEDVRERSYAVGAALARLLDALEPRWKSEVESGSAGSLDEALGRALGPSLEDHDSDCPPSAAELDRARAAAAGDVEDLTRRLGHARADFLDQPGWRVVVIAAPGEPLSPAGFDPLNVLVVDDREVLHGRWVKLGGEAGELEVLEGRALTAGVGPHPLFNGIERVTIAGLAAQPVVAVEGDAVRLESGPLNVDLRRAEFQRDDRTITLRVLPSAS